MSSNFCVSKWYASSFFSSGSFRRGKHAGGSGRRPHNGLALARKKYARGDDAKAFWCRRTFGTRPVEGCLGQGRPGTCLREMKGENGCVLCGWYVWQFRNTYRDQHIGWNTSMRRLFCRRKRTRAGGRTEYSTLWFATLLAKCLRCCISRWHTFRSSSKKSPRTWCTDLTSRKRRSRCIRCTEECWRAKAGWCSSTTPHLIFCRFPWNIFLLSQPTKKSKAEIGQWWEISTKYYRIFLLNPSFFRRGHSNDFSKYGWYLWARWRHESRRFEAFKNATKWWRSRRRGIINENQFLPLKTHTKKTHYHHSFELSIQAFFNYFNGAIKSQSSSDMPKENITNIMNSVPVALTENFSELTLDLIEEIAREFSESSKVSAGESNTSKKIF